MSSSIVLADICSLVSNKVDVEATEAGNYVSTENMVTNRGGVRKASSIPISGSVTGYKCGDVLVSNIRPYFKKIWLANRDGGASNDVLVFRPNLDIVDGRYFYYLLAGDKFFAYVMASAKGAKMPRGDKAQIMKYPVDPPDMATQRKIADILGSLDDKIELNRQMNETLEQIGQALFRHYFIDNPDAKNWPVVAMGDVLSTLESGSRPKGGAVHCGVPSIGAENIVGLGKYDYSKEKYISNDYFNKLKRGKIQSGDVLLYKDGAYVGRKSMFGNGFPHAVAAVNEHVFIMRTNERLPSQAYLYFWLCQPKITELIVNAGVKAAQPGINQGDVRVLPIVVPSTSNLCDFNRMVVPIVHRIFYNSLQSNCLNEMRDSLAEELI